MTRLMLLSAFVQLLQHVSLTSAQQSDSDSIVSHLYMHLAKPYQRPAASQQQQLQFDIPVRVQNTMDEMQSQLTQLTNKQKKLQSLAHDSHERDVKHYTSQSVKLMHTSTVDAVVELNDKWMNAETVESVEVQSTVKLDTSSIATTANHILILDSSSHQLHIYSKHNATLLKQLSLNTLFNNSDSRCADSTAHISSVQMAVDKMTRATRVVIVYTVDRQLCTLVSVNSELTSIYRAVFELSQPVKSFQLSLMPTVYQLVVQSADDSVGLLSIVRSSIVRNRFSEDDAVFTAVDSVKSLLSSSIDGIVKVSVDKEQIPSNMTRLLFGQEPIWIKGADWGINRQQRREFALTLKDGQLMYFTTQHDAVKQKRVVVGPYVLPSVDDLHAVDVIASISTRFIAPQLFSFHSITSADDMNHHDVYGNAIEELMMEVMIVGKDSVVKLTVMTVDGVLLKLVKREVFIADRVDSVRSFIDRRGNAVTLSLNNQQLTQQQDKHSHVIGLANRIVACLDVDECGVWTMVKNKVSDSVSVVRVHNAACQEKRHVLHPHATELQQM